MGPCNLSLPLNLAQQDKLAKVKQLVKDQLGSDVLLTHTDEVWTLDRSTNSWRIHEETVQADPQAGKDEVDVILDRRVGARPVLCQLPYADRLCKEAFEDHDDKLCAVRQLAAVLKLPLTDVLQEMRTIDEQLYGSNRENSGCTPRMVLEYCRREGISCAIVHNDMLVRPTRE